MKLGPAFLFAATLVAQSTSEISLTGQITDSITHQPIDGAKIVARGSVTANSDANGQYSLRIENLNSQNPRTPLIEVSRIGYASVRALLSLKAGSPATRDFELSRSSTVSGRLTDRDSGDPLTGIIVRAEQIVPSSGEQLGFFAASDASGTDGSFSIPNVAPGEYILKIDPQKPGTFSAGEKKSDRSGYSPVWFPNVPRRSMATHVSVAPAENRTLEIRVQKHELRRITGTLQVPQGMENDGIWMGARAPSAPLEYELPKAGKFQLDDLEEGSYTIMASTKTTSGHTRVFASRTVEVTDRDIDDLKLILLPAVALRAQIKMAEPNVEVPVSVGFFVLPLDGWALDSGISNTAPLRITDLPPGEYWPGLNIPAGYAVASVTYNGQPVPPSTSIQVNAPDSVVSFVLTSHLGRVSGTVRDGDQRPVPSASVWVLPSSLPETVDRFFLQYRGTGGSVKTGAIGEFFLDGLAPGRYKAIALPAEDREHAGDIPYLRTLLPYADTVVLESGQSVTLELRVH